VVRVHDATLRLDSVTFVAPLAATFQWIFIFLIALVPNCWSSYAEKAVSIIAAISQPGCSGCSGRSISRNVLQRNEQRY